MPEVSIAIYSLKVCTGGIRLWLAASHPDIKSFLLPQAP